MTQLDRMHHIAYVVKDQEAARHFYEDVIGLPLVATWAEVGEFPQFPGRKLEYCHTFFGLGDGSALAFFAFADDDVYETMKNHNGMAHAAIAVTADLQQKMRARLEEAGYTPTFRDHGYCQSLYVEDPDHLVMEFTSEPESSPETGAWQLQTAHETLARWVAGDHEPNNMLRH
jgi:catechol 2,3-dioxygenase-like lactoylglutathione lyase family enzyme